MEQILQNPKLSQAWNIGVFHAVSNMGMKPPSSAKFSNEELNVYVQGYKSVSLPN